MSNVEEEFEDQEDLDADAEVVSEDLAIGELDEDDGLEDLDDETRKELKVVEEVLSQKEQNARSLAIRRALEARAEERRLHDDLDYLDD